MIEIQWVVNTENWNWSVKLTWLTCLIILPLIILLICYSRHDTCICYRSNLNNFRLNFFQPRSSCFNLGQFECFFLRQTKCFWHLLFILLLFISTPITSPTIPKSSCPRQPDGTFLWALVITRFEKLRVQAIVILLYPDFSFLDHYKNRSCTCTCVLNR